MSLRDQIRAKLNEPAPAWPVGTSPFAVEDILARARSLEAAALRGATVLPSLIDAINTLGAYVESLPEALRAETSQRLVAAVNAPARFEAGVAPKTKAMHVPERLFGKSVETVASL